MLIAGHGELPSVASAPPPWTRHAACADLDVAAFFPEQHGSKGTLAAARAVCARCPVQGQCLQWALDHNETGIWAGTTDNQRRQMRRRAA